MVDYTRAINEHKKLVISVSVIVLLAVIILVISLVGWKNYQNGYQSWHDELSQHTQNALKMPSKTSDDKAKKLVALKEIGEEAAKSSDVCTPSLMIRWQQSLFSNQQKVEDCKKIIKDVDNFSSSLRRVIAHLDTESKLSAIFNGARTDAEIDETRWQEVVVSWENAVRKIKDLKVSQDFSDIKKTALSAAESIHRSWQLLVTASKAEDQDKFSAATMSLTDSYKKLDGVTGAANKQFSQMISDLEKSYDTAF